MQPRTLFCFFWALFTLFHQADEQRFSTLGFDLVVNAAAVAALLRPSSGFRLAVLCLAQVIAAWLALPLIVNHWMLTFLVSLATLAILVERLMRAGCSLDFDEWFDRFAPVVRMAVILTYFFAFLAKLNPDFRDPGLSCGAHFYRVLSEVLPFLPSGRWAYHALIWFTLVVEAALPILLATQKTRVVGILVGMGFHTILSLTAFYEFAAQATAFYCLFLPSDFSTRARHWLERHATLKRRAQAVCRLAGRPLSFEILLVALYLVLNVFELEFVKTVLPANPRGLPAAYLLLPLWVSIACVLIACLVLILREKGPIGGGDRGYLSLRHPLYGLGVAIVVVNGLCPYVGLKTEHSFTMFSNLRTEPERWNHDFLPESVRIFSSQGRPRTLSDSPHYLLRKLTLYKRVPRVNSCQH